GICRAGRRAVWLLHAGHPALGEVLAGRERGSDAGRDPGGARGKPVPVHGLHQDPRGSRACCGADEMREYPHPPGRAERAGATSPRGGEVKRAGATSPRGGEVTNSLRVIGKPLPKVDAAAKVTGRAIYADDMLPARTLHCRILRSPHPYARIRSIDTSAARRIPGVIAVITGADLPIKFGILPVTQDERALEHEKVRYVGDPIAAVAATDEEIAAAACDAIDVEY